MPDFSSYELANFLLFSPRTYELLVEDYNHAVWPLHLLALLSGIAIVILAAQGRGRLESTIGTALLATAWITVAWAFHLERYASINWTAKWFAAAFVVQAALVVGTELVPRRSSRTTLKAIRVAGSTLALVAIVALPLIQRVLGESWSRVETFALFPDATAMATLGVLLMRERLDWHLLVIPVLWCGIGSATLAAMGRPDAVIPIAAALAAFAIAVWKTVATRRVDA